MAQLWYLMDYLDIATVRISRSSSSQWLSRVKRANLSILFFCESVWYISPPFLKATRQSEDNEVSIPRAAGFTMEHRGGRERLSQGKHGGESRLSGESGCLA